MILSNKTNFIKQVLQVVLHFPTSLVRGVFWFISQRSWHYLVQSKKQFLF